MDGRQTSVKRMALYSNLRRAEEVLAREGWSIADTEAFAHMHYLGTDSLDGAAAKLGLKAGQEILDVGSGFGGTGRYLGAKYGCTVTGVELQEAIAAIAERINRKFNEHEDRLVVKTIVGDFLDVDLGQDFDHALSLLAILHVPLAQRTLWFRKISRHLKPGGKLYIEDYFRRRAFTGGEVEALDRIVSCPGLRSKEEYVADLENCGFVIEFEEVTEPWTAFVASRADAYAASEAPAADLVIFYRTVKNLFQGGNLGGARITAIAGRQDHPRVPV